MKKSVKMLSIGLAVTAGLVVGGVTVSRSEAALDWLGIEQKLQRHDEQIDNHENRISNTESDVKAVQEATNTAPSTERVIVREVTTSQPASSSDSTTSEPQPTSTPAPEPVTVVAYEEVPMGDEVHCKYTYSDGTTYTFRWKWYGTTREGRPVTYTHNACDQSIVGQQKPA